jgi:uncharacterized membrane protein YdfJ with MMPL/SSD domain
MPCALIARCRLVDLGIVKGGPDRWWIDAPQWSQRHGKRRKRATFAAIAMVAIGAVATLL